MRSSKQNKDQDLIFEAYASRVHPSKFDKVIDEAGAKKKVATTSLGKRLFRGIGRLGRAATDKLGITKAKPLTKKADLKLKGDEKLAKKAAAEDEAKKAADALAKRQARIAKAKEVGGKVKDAAVDVTKATGAAVKKVGGAAVDVAKAAGTTAKKVGGAAVDAATPAVKATGRAVVDVTKATGRGVKDLGKYGVDKALKNPKAVIGIGATGATLGGYGPLGRGLKKLTGDEDDTITKLDTQGDIADALRKNNPEMAGFSDEEVFSTPQGIAAIQDADLTDVTPTVPPVDDDKGFLAKRYLDDKGELKGGRVVGDLAVGTAGAIGAKLAYDYLKPKKKKEEEEEAKKKSLYTASYNPQQSKSGYDII